MKIANVVKEKMASYANGEIFTVSDFALEPKYDMALAKTLSRMSLKGELQKVSKGKYYKPQKTILGQLKPEMTEIIKDLLFKDNEVIGYVTGIQAFASMGLTTQISSTILIGTNEYRRPIKRGAYLVKFLRQKNTITESNIELLRILDAIKYIKEIPATSPDEVCKVIIEIIRNLDAEKLDMLEKLTFGYTGYVRAVVGAIFEQLGLYSTAIRMSLNGLTTYKLPITEIVLPNKTNWNIYESTRRNSNI